MADRTLYDYPFSGNCYKVRLLLAMLGLEYQRVPVDIATDEAGLSLEPFPGVRAWLGRVEGLPGWRSLLESRA